MSPADLMKPGLHFMLIEHDKGCLTPATLCESDCTCSPTPKIVTESRFLGAIEQTRRVRRKAARQAEKALHKARGRT